MKVSLTSLRKLAFFIVVGTYLVLPSGSGRAEGGEKPPQPWLSEEDVNKKLEENDPFKDSTSQQYLGRITANNIAFSFMNNYLMMNQVYDHLRGVQLVTYYDEAGVGEGAGTAGANWSTGGMDTAPYGPGYAPAYEQSLYNSNAPIYQGAARYGDIFRGQTAEYGDPGTLIYSLWGGATAGGGKIENHYEVAGYDTEQYGGLVGLDLFCSCDCRSGLFYAYQNTKIKGVTEKYTWGRLLGETLMTPEDEMIATGKFSPETQYPFYNAYRNICEATASYNGTYNATLQSKNHLIGIYHQFGDEFTYNIATVRAGYNRVTSTETITEEGTAGVVQELQETMTYDKTTHEAESTDEYPEPWFTPEEPEGIEVRREETSENSATDSLNNNYDVYLAGLSFERGANFRLAPFTITPRGQLDYTFLYRMEGKGQTALGGNYLYKKKDYHSLRSHLGADLSIDLYPGEMRLRGLVRGGWVHEFLNGIYGDTDITYDSSPVVPAYNATVQGNTMGRDWALLGAEVDWTIVPEFMIFATYDYMKNKYLGQSFGTLGASLMW